MWIKGGTKIIPLKTFFVDHATAKSPSTGKQTEKKKKADLLGTLFLKHLFFTLDFGS